MKKSFLIAVSATILAGGVYVADKAATANQDTVLSKNVDVLSASETITVGQICAYQPEKTCDWYYPDGSWDILDDLIRP